MKELTDKKVNMIGKITVKYFKNNTLLEDKYSCGTGFLVSPNKIMTALHVIENKEILENHNDITYTIHIKINRQEYNDLNLIEKDEVNDMALLEVKNGQYFKDYFELIDYPLVMANNYIKIKGDIFAFPSKLSAPDESQDFILPRFEANIQEYYTDNYNLSVELNTKVKDNLSGMSGAPFVVNNFVYGIIIKQTVPKMGKDVALKRIVLYKSLLEKYDIKIREYAINPKLLKLPEIHSRYCERPEENDLSDLINAKDKPVIQIHGLSGIGKTELVSKVIHTFKHQDPSTAIIWVECDENKKIDLSSINTYQFDRDINLLDMMKTHKLLIVLDNLNSNIEQIQEVFLKNNQQDSKLIIISRDKNLSNEQSLKVDFLEPKLAKNLFEGCKNINDKQIDSFVEYIKGHPLLINLIVDGINNDKFNTSDLLEDIERIHNIKDTTVSRQQKFCARIVGQYIDCYKSEFKFLVQLNKNLLDKEFVQFSIGVQSKSELEAASIINDISDYNIYIHTLVYNSIKELIEISESDKNIFKKYIIKYLELKIDLRDVCYHKFVLHNINLIKDLYINEHTKDKQVLFIGWLDTMNYKINYREILDEINSLNLECKSYFDLRILVEKCEIEYSFIEDIDKEQEKVLKIEKGNAIIKQYNEYLEAVKTQPKSVELLNHHLGKIHMKIHELEVAEQYFNNLLESKSLSYNAKLQLARIYKNQYANTKDLEEQLLLKNKGEKIISDALKKKGEMGLTILLGFYDLISTEPFKELEQLYLKNQFNEFINILKASLDENFDYVYSIIKSFSNTLAYDYPDEYEKLLNMLPVPSHLDQNKELILNYGQIYAADYKRIKFSKKIDYTLKGPQMKVKFELAERYLLQYVNNNTDSAQFNFKYLLDLYKKSSKYKEAEILLDKYYDPHNPYHLKDRSEIYRNMDETKKKKSTELINKAIDIITENPNKHKTYISSFYNEYAESFHANKNPQCIDMLDIAIKMCDNDNAKTPWKVKKNKWKKELGIN